jgi:hypothetical protein
MGSCSDDGASSDAEPAATFSFEQHDLCDWVNAEKISEFVSSQFEWDGEVAESDAPADLADFEERGTVACSWELSGNEPGHVTIFAPTTLAVGDETYDFAEDVDLGVGRVMVDGPVLGHPSLSTDVVYFTEPWHNTAFGTPANGRYLIASFELPGLYPPTNMPQEEQEERWDRWFAVVDQILGELGWT